MALTSPASQPSPRILVVGAGLSGCVAAWCVRRAVGSSAQVHVWDGARGCGGRLATQRVLTKGGEEVRMNMGASRLHFKQGDNSIVHEELIDNLEKAGVVQVVHQSSEGGILLPKGASNEICRFLLDKAKAETAFQSRIKSIDFVNAKNQFSVSLFGKDKSKAEEFDAVVFAGSPAEVRTTHGGMRAFTSPMWRQLRHRVQYTRNCCLGLAFRDTSVVKEILEIFKDSPVFTANDAQGVIEELVLQSNHTTHRMEDNTQQSNKRKTPSFAVTEGGNGMAILVAVSTEKFANTHCRQLRATHRPTPEDREQQQLITERLRIRVFQILAKICSGGEINPQALLKAVVAQKMNYWKYAQVQIQQQSSNNSKASCFIADCPAPFIVVGDYFPWSHVAQPATSQSSQKSNHNGNNKSKACGFTAVVRSGEEAANQVAKVLLLAGKSG